MSMVDMVQTVAIPWMLLATKTKKHIEKWSIQIVLSQQKNQACGNGILRCMFALVRLGEGYETGISALRTPGYCGCCSDRWTEAELSEQLWRPQASRRKGRVEAWCCRGTAGAWQEALDGIQTLGGQGRWYSEKGIPWDVWIKSMEGKGTWWQEVWTRHETTSSSSKRKTLFRDLQDWICLAEQKE